MTRPITVAAVDNHEIVREGLAQLMDRSGTDITLLAAVDTVERLLEEQVADVILLDLLLADGESTGSIPVFVERGSRVLIYTTEERPVPLRRAVRAGASGVLLKSDPLAGVIDAVRSVMTGDFCCSGPLAHALLHDPHLVAHLSDQEVQVLHALDEGLDYRATARVLGITQSTVKTYLSRIRAKYAAVGPDPRNSHHVTRLASKDGYLR